MNTLRIPKVINFGKDALSEAEYPKNALVVTTAPPALLVNGLTAWESNYMLYDKVTPEPSIDDVNGVISEYKYLSEDPLHNIRKNIVVENGEVDLILLIRYLITIESLASHYVTILYYACHKAYCDNTDNHCKSFNTVHNNITLGRRLNFIKKYGLKKYVDNIDT